MPGTPKTRYLHATKQRHAHVFADGHRRLGGPPPLTPFMDEWGQIAAMICQALRKFILTLLTSTGAIPPDPSHASHDLLITPKKGKKMVLTC